MMAQISMDQLTQDFAGVEFPASKSELIQAAQDNNAPGDHRKMYETLPEKEYQDLNEVQQVLMQMAGGQKM